MNKTICLMAIFLSLSAGHAIGKSPTPDKKGEIIVSEETHGPKKYLRVRVFGAAALEMCKLIGTDLSTKPANYTEDIPADKSGKQAKTCFRTDAKGDKGFGVGFLLQKDQSTRGLEAEGYD